MASTTIGGLIGWGLGAYGKKPKVPDITDIDVNKVQQDTIAGNLLSFADIAKLATTVNAFNQDQLTALIEQVLPGVSQQMQKNILSQSRGEIPADVIRQINNYSAARGNNALARGSGFSFSSAQTNVRDSSLAMIDRALSSAERWGKMAFAPQFDVTSMFLSVADRLKRAEAQQALQYSNDLLRAGVAAAPDPAMAAIAQGIDQDIARIENAAVSYFGGKASNEEPVESGGGGSTSMTSNYWGLGSGNFGFGWDRDSSGSRNWYLGRNPGKG